MTRLIRGFGVLSLLLSAATTFMLWDRYWRWRDCFNEAGRCFDAETGDVLLAQSGVAWGALTLLFLCLGLALLFLARLRT